MALIGHHRSRNLEGHGRITLVLGASLLGGLCCYLGVYRLGILSSIGPLRNLAATLAATLPLGIAVWSIRGVEQPRRRDLLLLSLGMLALRLCVPLELIEGSDDAYRYLWDGLVLNSGVNPYAHAPQAPALLGLRDEAFFPHIFRPDMRTVYPPLAQAWFWLSYRLTPQSFTGLKLVLLAHECASLGLLIALLRRRGTSPMAALIYAWSPLAVTQLFAGCHLDGLLVPWCLLSLLLARDRPLWAGAALAAAVMVRPVMILCLPGLLGRRPWREAGLGLLGFAAAAAVLVAPFSGAGRGMVESLFVYARHWRFNSSLFRLIEEAMPLEKAVRIRRRVYATVAVGATGSGWLPIERPARYLCALGLYLALAPTVYPWYMLAPLAVGVLYPSPLTVALPAVISISDLVFVSNAFAGPWEVPSLALVLEYTLLYGLILFEIVRRWRGRPRRTEARSW